MKKWETCTAAVSREIPLPQPLFMLILGIETSCDETAVCIVSATGDIASPSFSVLGNALNSQIKIHEQYGGVFPALAKREHSKNIVPLFIETLKQAKLFLKTETHISPEKIGTLKTLLDREPELFTHLKEHIFQIEKPAIDAIAVTVGPGLEPALWVGINFARALSLLWDIPIIPVNHMEGHIVSVLVNRNEIVDDQFSKILNSNSETKDHKLSTNNSPILFPALALLISGGHTELILIETWGKYANIGQTRDDAVGEAFDKVARMLGLPYPGGPAISALAEKARNSEVKNYPLPRPMLHTKDFDFSFSGLKTAVLYLTQELKVLTEKDKEAIAREFEDAVTEVLVTKTKKALEHYGAQTLIIGGGVIANTHIRKAFESLVVEYPHVELFFPTLALSTDNAVMIACAGYMQHLTKTPHTHATPLIAKGNLSL